MVVRLSDYPANSAAATTAEAATSDSAVHTNLISSHLRWRWNVICNKDRFERRGSYPSCREQIRGG